MTERIDPTEAHAIACAKLLAALPHLLDRPGLQRVLDWLDERRVLQDGQEDPGAVEAEGLALELAIADSFGQLARTLRETVAD
ncbi:hypothetical protein GL279_06875 [Paracoccus limosus]|jgi:hypothetical protein|uniref:Uncharacterized protein n=1 Tax=Paracoccus limosus TaxID=913252 RepID=A0A844H0F7_9RHOB|nr:hypothetical protein [Paracoccus limosus]MTH34322.1 hypothetical protein [Paracoccus limosus]